MAIAHRFSAPFISRKSTSVDHAPRPVSEEHSSSPISSSTISCLPWEGLYLEQGNAAEAPHPGDAAVAVELDRFLDTLLSGK
ncbi:hypothetical protein [Arthrobacter cavernae]|uniref:Uncharacterized protein n=1 Tax=Arthrobacter cavernae TaxID=2817681 RepID=A0A939KJ34_9MICC|nr:hypothetical protein [Arthrobacter cavernae]MBO1267284.1 hypothetical protein [Arthrobacter cavernae]